MGLFEKIFPRKEQKWREETEFRSLTAYTPRFTTWNGYIYESELVRASIDAIGRHFSKMNVVLHGAAKPKLQAKLKHAPNEWSTWSQFLYRTATILNNENNCVIVPVINRYGETLGVYPVFPRKCSVMSFNDVPYLRLEFERGQYAAVELDKCGIMTRFQYKSDFFGEANDSLRPTMELMNLQNQAIQEGVKNSATYRFMATLGNFANAEDLAKERKRFTQENLRGSDGGGVLLFPNTYKDIRQIESKPFVVDAEQQKLIQNNVFQYFGVNEAILQNSADADMVDAFYSGCIEPLAVQLSEVLTKMLFTTLERSNGSRVEVSSNRLSNMSIKNKITFATSMADRGMVTIDEIRAMFGYDPLPNGDGNKAPIRGEYYFVDEGKVSKTTSGLTSEETALAAEEEEDAEPTE